MPEEGRLSKCNSIAFEASGVTAQYVLKQAYEPVWSRRLALFFFQLLILTGLLHHFASLSTPAAINLVAVSGVGLFAALVLGIAGLLRIWYGDYYGVGEALVGIVIAVIGLAPLASFGFLALKMPPLSQVSTTPERPILFKDMDVRPADAIPIVSPSAEDIALQEESYRDIHPLVLERSAAEAFGLTREAMRRLNWDIVVSEPPVQNSLGYLQATDRTLIMGFTDDIAVEILGDEATATVDARSVSRYGNHDFGTNAGRIRELFAEINAGIKKGERPALEQAEPAPPIPQRTPGR